MGTVAKTLAAIAIALFALRGAGCGSKDALDRDGDGVPDKDDCAPDDPTISPLAREIPNNGIDENCLGGDLVLATSPDAQPPAKTTPPAAKATSPDAGAGP